jgi:hypothetical protein
MGEMAKYKGQAVKIGTCEMMYYLRYEDRNLVTAMPNNVNPMDSKDLFFRLPLPEEDGIGPGGYNGHQPFRGGPNEYYISPYACRLDNLHPSFADVWENPGLVQTTVPQLGMLVNLKCYHGLKLNEDSEGAKFGWNGKHDGLSLSYLKDSGQELRVVISCVACNQMWSYSFLDIEKAIINPIMKERIRKLCSDYQAQRRATTVTAINI